MRDILVVEDGLHERERLERLFVEANYSVACAESAEEAEKILGRHQFRLVILDIGLGDKSGSYLFERLRGSAKAPLVIILTGNPSIHLKQRFLDQGAIAYVVKASEGASNEALLEMVTSRLGPSTGRESEGIPLLEFIGSYLGNVSEELFLDGKQEVPPCSECGANTYVVVFDHKTQLPPIVEGKVVCQGCGQPMDLEVG